MTTLERIFNFPFTDANPEKVYAEVIEDREGLLCWMDMHKIDPDNVEKIYIAEQKIERQPGELTGIVTPARIVIRLDAKNSYREKEVDFLRRWYNTLHAAFEDITNVDVGFASGLEEKLKRAIEAMGFVELELVDGQCVGFNPRKFAVLKDEAGRMEHYMYSNIENEHGHKITVKGGPVAVNHAFENARIFMDSANAFRKQAQQDRWGGTPIPHVNPYLKASKPETHLK